MVNTLSDFQRFFEKSAEVFAAPGAPDRTRILEIAREHDMDFIQADPAATGRTAPSVSVSRSDVRRRADEPRRSAAEGRSIQVGSS